MMADNMNVLSAKEMLEVVQKTKDRLARAIIENDSTLQRHAEWFATAFLSAHYAQVLDILEDALYEHVRKELK